MKPNDFIDEKTEFCNILHEFTSIYWCFGKFYREISSNSDCVFRRDLSLATEFSFHLFAQIIVLIAYSCIL